MRILAKIGLTFIFILYIFILSNLILFKYYTIPEIIRHFTFHFDGTTHGESHNFIPFKTIYYYLFADINLSIRVENLAGNIIGFAPFGLLFPLFSKRFQQVKKIMISTFCLSLTFELLQLVFKFGSFDVDDLMLNTLGGLLGYLPIHLVILLVNNRKAQNQNKVSAM